MDSAVIWDAEFLTAPGAPRRFWCGPDDPDPVLVQIGAVRLGLTADFAIGESLSCVVVPRDRKGDRYPISGFFAELTGISARRVAEEGVELAEGLARLNAFAAGAPMWAWGTDELNAIAVSCYLAGLAPPIPATRFGNATRLLAVAGVPRDEIHGLRSDRLAGHFGLSHHEARAHDARSDAMSTALALQYLLREGRLRAEAFVLPD